MGTLARNCVVLFCVILLGAGLVAQWRQRAIRASGRTETRIVALSGERLKTPFDGLLPTARYEWKKISAQAAHGRASCQTQARMSRLERILVAVGIETVAYAEFCSCPTEACAGEFECFDFTICDPCFGSVDNPDFQCGPDNQGENEDGTGCIDCLCALCNRPLCRD